MDNKELSNMELSGGTAFYAMLGVLIFMVIACIVCPLAIPGFSKQGYAVPLMAAALGLPFVHFFIFGGMEIVRSRKK
ncbi:hypothetical protein AAC978_12515 [Desulfitobacterium sp. THU1]|uniref:hypothetical protein n=1 Tax=Desulfitobacterium sp. THU1 TaxID=3138072 RepID=UPI0031201B7E